MNGIVNPRISFDPPLPFTGDQLRCGFIVEASRTELLIKSSEALSTHRTDTLTVLGSDAKTYTLQISRISLRGAATGELTAVVTETPENLRKFDDLLGGIRKSQHIKICQTQDVESSDRYTGFNDLHFVPTAIPDMSWDELDTSTEFLGETFSYPILITGMTGGIEKGAEINRRLARAAASLNIPMGIGSQRLALENPECSHIFAVKQHAPHLFLIGNMGFAQLNLGYGVETCQRAVDMIDANALAIHVNVLQEVIQVEGDRDFRKLIDKIGLIAQKLRVPVIVKEVGNGIDPQTARRLREVGVAAIDVGGRGGTSWGYIEGLRSHAHIVRHVAETFRDWGIPTAHALAAVRETLPSLPLIATGGIRDGLTVAKAVALGAQLVGVGLPLLRAALISDDEPLNVLQSYIHDFRTALICTNSKNISELQGKLVQGLPFADAIDDRLKSGRSREEL